MEGKLGRQIGLVEEVQGIEPEQARQPMIGETPVGGDLRALGHTLHEINVRNIADSLSKLTPDDLNDRINQMVQNNEAVLLIDNTQK